jgi:hypothetical protein
MQPGEASELDESLIGCIPLRIGCHRLLRNGTRNTERETMTDKKKYIRDVTLEEYTKAVLETDSDLDKKIRQAEIDPSEILTAEFKEGIDKYTAAAGLSLGRSTLRDALQEKMSTEVKGLVVGMRDRYGAKSPIRYPILKSDGNHLEVSHFGITVKKGNSKIEISFPSIVTAKILESDWKGKPVFNLIALTAIEPVQMEKALSMIQRVAKTVDKLHPDDEGAVVVLKGRIGFVEPTPIFKDGERVGEYPILLENSRDVPQKIPVLQVSLNAEGGANRVRVTFDRQHSAMPTISVDDMMELASEAVQRAPDNPVEQAKFVGQGLIGRDVLVVGYLGKFKTINNNNYIEVGGYAIYDMPGSADQNWFGVGGKAVAKEPEDEPDDEPEPVKEPVKETKKEPKKEEKKEEKPKKKDSSSKAMEALGNVKVKDADSLKVWLKNYCLLLKIDIDDVDAGIVMSILKTDLPESVIQETIDELRG